MTPSPRPTHTPTASPGPNARPAALAFGHLYYTSEGCWSSGWTDSSGTRVDLVRSDIRVTVKNSGQRPSDFLWIEVKSTGPGATHPAYYKTNWSDTGWYVPVDDRAMLLGGPQIQPGETREIAWTSLFETKSDVSYTVTLLPGPDPTLYNDRPGGPTLTKSPVHKTWSLTTTNKPCR